MKSKVLIAGAIVTIVIACLATLVAITMALQEPAKSMQGTCSVQGYVVNTLGEGIPGAEVTLHVVGNDNMEIYNMTAPTNGSQPYVGLYAFNSVVITPDVQYAYVSTSVLENNITYHDRTDNFTLEDNATINKSIAFPGGICMMVKNQTSPIATQAPVQTASNSIYGYIFTTYGKGIPGVTVTLHMMGEDGNKDLYDVTTVTNSTEPFVGQYIFENVTPVDGTQFVYTSASVHAGDIGIYGKSNNYTFSNASSKSISIVLHIPPECQNSTLSSP